MLALASCAHNPRLPVAAKRTRLHYLDSLRGFLLVIMAINHLPTVLRRVTDHPFGYMSAAEGFVFLAGLMAGLVYTRKLLRDGAAAFRQTCQSRAWSIYLHHLFAYGVIFAGTLWYAYVTGHRLPHAPSQMAMQPLLASVTGPTLLYQPALLDVLPMYCGFILLVPLTIHSLERGHRTWVLALSFTLWAVTNLFCPQVPLTTALLNTGAFNICAWQLLFVLGVVCGHAWTRQTKFLPELSAKAIALLAAVATLFFCIRHAFLWSRLSPETLAWLTNKNNVAPLRLIDTAVILLLLRQIVRRYPQALTWRPFAFLGRASISVFTAHVITVYALGAFPNFFASSDLAQWAGVFVVLGTMTATAYVHALLRKSARAHSTTTINSELAS